jgi:uncharacterized membrane-anchored protein YhcB (DUF1043 family)
MKKLVENIVVSPTSYRKAENLTESEKTLVITEGKDKKSYKALAVYTFPISRPGEKNLNERIYPVKLWENVIKKKMGEGQTGLMDHPEREGSTKDEWCVWRNLRFSEDKKLILADAYLFGPYGQQVKEKLEAGGKVGLSTSGMGEFEEDDITVAWKSYELERPADHVLNPSYAVFGEEDGKIEQPTETKESVQENVEQTSIKEEIDNGDNKMKLNSMEEKSFRLNVAARMKDISGIENISERVSEYTELLGYFEEGVAEDLKEAIETAVLEGKEEIKALAEKGSKLETSIQEAKVELEEKVSKLTKVNEELINSNSELAEKFEKSAELLDSLKAYSNKMKEMFEVAVAEKNGMFSATEYKEALVFAEQLEEEKTDLQKTVNDLREKLKIAREKVAKTVSSKEEGVTSEEALEEDIEEEKDIFEGIAPSIVSYYQDLETASPEVVAIREDILSAKTLMEAQRTYLRLKSLTASGKRSLNRDRADGDKSTKSFSKKSVSVRKGWV